MATSAGLGPGDSLSLGQTRLSHSPLRRGEHRRRLPSPLPVLPTTARSTPLADVLRHLPAAGNTDHRDMAHHKPTRTDKPVKTLIQHALAALACRRLLPGDSDDRCEAGAGADPEDRNVAKAGANAERVKLPTSRAARALSLADSIEAHESFGDNPPVRAGLPCAGRSCGTDRLSLAREVLRPLPGRSHHRVRSAPIAGVRGRSWPSAVCGIVALPSPGVIAPNGVGSRNASFVGNAGADHPARQSG